MAKYSMFAVTPLFERVAGRRRNLLRAATFVSALLLAGCAVEVQNRQAAQELAQLRQPPGSIYTGWRVFQDKCAPD